MCYLLLRTQEMSDIYHIMQKEKHRFHGTDHWTQVIESRLKQSKHNCWLVGLFANMAALRQYFSIWKTTQSNIKSIHEISYFLPVCRITVNVNIKLNFER